MHVESKIEHIRRSLTDHFSPVYLEVIDDSNQHVGHAGYRNGGRHFTIIISAAKFLTLSRLDAHRKIYALFDDLIPDEIHALRIKVLPLSVNPLPSK